MRSHAKARAAGSTKRMRAGRKPALLLVSLAAAVAALALVVGPASGATTRFLVEVFGSSAQPTFPADRGMAFDQGSEDLHVIDSTNDTLTRYNADGTPSSFSALGTNVIDGEGAGDETAHGHLGFSFNDEREQVALDESGEATDGNIYLTQSEADVVDIFNAAGEYLGELSESTGGAFGEPCGVAVDSEGTVYVGDRGDDMIHVFEPEALATAPVNADNTASYTTLSNPCSLAAGAGATAGFLFANQSTGSAHKVDAATGEVKYEIASSVNTVSVDPTSGHVFVAKGCCSSSAVEEYDASGAAEASLVSSFQPGSTVEGVAANSANEQVYVSRSGTENVEVFGPPAVVPDVTTEAPTSNTGTRATLAGTVNPDGVELDECFFEWTQSSSNSVSEYDNVVPCAQTPAEIGAGTAPVSVHADISGLTPQDTRYHYRLVAVNPNATIEGSNQVFRTPDTVLTEAATGVTPTEATLNGSVNPDTEPISECLFEWGPEKGPLEEFQTFPETAPCVPGPAGITGESPVAVQVDISELHPGTTYVYRLKAAYPTGPIVDGVESVQTLGPVIADSWAEDVVITEAILKAEITPEGAETTFRFEYGTTEAYGSQTPETVVGSGSSEVEVSAFLDDLAPGTTYHWRAVATSGVAVNEGPDRTIRTFRPFEAESDCPNQARRLGPSANLPDCRAYEMVSPVDKENGDIKVLPTNEFALPARLEKSTPSGEKLAYNSYRSFGDAQSAPHTSSYIARRTGEGWQTHSINTPRTEPFGIGGALASLVQEYKAFSDDLCQGWVVPAADPPLAPAALAEERNFYRRQDRLCGPEGYQALAPIVPPTGVSNMELQGTSADGTHAFFSSGGKLSPEGTAGSRQLYESVEPEAPLRFVCVLPGGEPHTGGCQAGGASQGWRTSNLTGAISEDGERIFWLDGDGFFANTNRIYVRVGGTETLPVSQAAEEAEGSEDSSEFWGAATDGSRAIFTTKPPSSGTTSLYSFELEGEASEKIAAGVEGVVGISDDARRVYFVSREALPESGQNSEGAEAIAGRPNVYLHEAGEGGGTFEFIATVANDDIALTGSTGSLVQREPRSHLARVTPDGLHAAFSSEASLTGYDNRSLTDGSPLRQAYLYDAVSQELVCASCNPSGARNQAGGDVPVIENSLHTSRPLSEDGSRLFFETQTPLVSRDTNGRMDVYQWEAEGAGGCDAGDSGFAPGAGGCVELISAGTSSVHSRFVEASADGNDVFFATASSLVSQDYGLNDIYDAKVGGGFPPPPEPPECSGDGCQNAPLPPNDPTPASAAFRGAGNPLPRANCGARARRAAKFSRRAKRLRRAAKRSSNPRRSKRMRRKSARFAKNAKRLSRNAKRCRRANRRANR